MARDRQRSKGRRKRPGGNPAGKPGTGQRAREIGLDDSQVEDSGLTDAPASAGASSPASPAAPDPLKNVSPDVDQAKAAETGEGRGEPGEPMDVGPSRAGVPGVTPAPVGPVGDPDEGFGGAEIYDDEIDDLERAPDELEHDLVPSPSGRVDPAVAAERAAKPHKERGRVLTFLRHCVEELRRVQWPDRKHVGQATAVVLGFVLVAGGYLGLMDAIWQPVVNAIL